MKALKLPRGLAAWVLNRCGHRFDERLHTPKCHLFKDIGGRVVEIGAGAGLNCKYFPQGIEYIAIEPNPAFHRLLRDEARKTGHGIEIQPGRAEKIRLASGSVDAVVSSLVLCSVVEPLAVLSEVKRVLRDGGTFYFLEHLAAPPGTLRRALQKMIKPFCLFCGDGCHPDREILKLIESSGFSRVKSSLLCLPHWPLAPLIIGRAVK